MVTKDQVTQMYIAMFQRAPSESEINYWYDTAQNNGLDIVGLANTMVEAAKNATNLFGLEDLYPQYANYDPNNPDSIKAIIESVYSTIFNKDATQDPDGVAYWTNEVLSGKSLGEVIVAIEDAAEDIAAHPEKYKDVFDEETLNEAINAAKAFEAKVQAANEIALKIQNVKTDAQSLKEMQSIIKEVKDTQDIDDILNKVDEIKDKVEASVDNDNTNDVNDINEDSTTQDNMDNNQENFTEYVSILSKMNDEDKIQFYNLLKEYIQNKANLYNSNSYYTEDMLNQSATVENDFIQKSNALFSKYGLPVDNKEYTVNYDFLNNDPNKLQEYYNLAKESYNEALKEISNVNPLDPNSYQGLFSIEESYDKQLASIIDDLPIYTENESSYEDNYNDYSDNNIYVDSGSAYIDMNKLSECSNNMDDKIIEQMSQLSPDESNALFNELSDYANNYVNNAIADGVFDNNELTEYIKGIEDIYAKYGIDVTSYYDNCLNEMLS